MRWRAEHSDLEYSLPDKACVPGGNGRQLNVLN
jgi:hypothetical protein